MKIEITEEQLLQMLREWFDNHDLDAPNFWKRNDVAKLIKNRISDSGRWRQKSRGGNTNMKGRPRRTMIEINPKIEDDDKRERLKKI